MHRNQLGTYVFNHPFRLCMPLCYPGYYWESKDNACIEVLSECQDHLHDDAKGKQQNSRQSWFSIIANVIILKYDFIITGPVEVYEFILMKYGKIYFGFKLFLVSKFFDQLFHYRNRRLAKFADFLTEMSGLVWFFSVVKCNKHCQVFCYSNTSKSQFSFIFLLFVSVKCKSVFELDFDWSDPS